MDLRLVAAIVLAGALFVAALSPIKDAGTNGGVCIDPDGANLCVCSGLLGCNH